MAEPHSVILADAEGRGPVDRLDQRSGLFPDLVSRHLGLKRRGPEPILAVHLGHHQVRPVELRYQIIKVEGVTCQPNPPFRHRDVFHRVSHAVSSTAFLRH